MVLTRRPFVWWRPGFLKTGVLQWLPPYQLEMRPSHQAEAPSVRGFCLGSPQVAKSSAVRNTGAMSVRRLTGTERGRKVMNASSDWPRNRLLLAVPSRNLKRLMPELEQIRCLLANFGKVGRPEPIIAKISQGGL